MKLAHTVKDGTMVYRQDLREHLFHVAELCRAYTKRVGCPSVGYIIGLLHDIGKASDEFQQYLENSINGKLMGKKVNHSSAGAVFLQQYLTEKSSVYERATVEMLSEVLFSHHAALPDNIAKDGTDGYTARIHPNNIYIMPKVNDYFWTEVMQREEFEEIRKNAFYEMEMQIKLLQKSSVDRKEFCYNLGLLEKYILSCLIDSDWFDTMYSEESKGMSYQNRIQDEIEQREKRRELFILFLNRLETKLNVFSQKDSELNYWRREISNQCKKAGSKQGGVYTLSCPTGTGKTLSSMRFALEHCIQNDKSQIFYIVPYTSIIDQNVESIKNILKIESSDELVEKSILELHSGKEMDEKDNQEEERMADFLTKRMSQPIVFTTMVRFLNTFFAKGTRNLRPMHQFQDAVIIFDEIQSLSVKHTAIFNGVLNFLTEICNCTCVLCTATQPLLGEVKKPVYPVKMQCNPKLVILPDEAARVFKRVQAIPLLKNGGYGVDELAELSIGKVEEMGNVLLIMNTKTAALKVYEEIERSAGGEVELLYLSTLLYPKHRKKVIATIKKYLIEQRKLIVVSTQIVEAGVDFDFKCVIRSLAGIESIVQAAGRCNREGKDTCGRVYIVNPNSNLERTESLRDIAVGKTTAFRVIREYDANSKQFNCELLSEAVINRFFQYYYAQRKTEMIYPIRGVSEYSLYDLLSDNNSLLQTGKKHYQYIPRILNQAFKEAAEQFEAIEENGESVFVPRGDGHVLWEEIQKTDDSDEYRNLLKQAQQYVINIRRNQLNKLEKGVIHWEDRMNMYMLNEDYYHEKKGFQEEIGETIPLLNY